MHKYLDLLEHVLKYGEKKMDRTGTGTLSVFGTRLEFDLQEGFPAVTTKELWMKGVWHELLWFLKGDEYITYLREHKVKIWEEWANADGYVGPVYGVQWRKWPDHKPRHGSYIGPVYIDQLKNSIDMLITDRHSRRNLVSAWNVAELPRMNLPPCHILYQFYVREETFLDCQVYQRSADMFLGVPFDIASYATLMHMVCELTGYKPGRLVYVFGDTHIYLNHIDQVKEQLNRKPYTLPLIDVNCRDRKIESIDDFEYEDLVLYAYTHHPAIKAPISK